MGDSVNIQDAVLELAGSSLVAAAARMLDGSGNQPAFELATVSGIGAEVAEVMRGLQTGGFALADAAKTASLAVAEVMHASGELDSLISEELYSGFAVSRGRW